MKNILSKLETKLESSLEDNTIYNTSFLDKDYSTNSNAPKKYKKAAVLCLFDCNCENLSIILTLRSKKLTIHPGQISFPGGKLNKEENNYDCALRETFEEIGIKKRNIPSSKARSIIAFLSASNCSEYKCVCVSVIIKLTYL